MKRLLFIVIGVLTALSLFTGVSWAQTTQSGTAPVTIHLFASKTCPHCQAEKEFLTQYKQTHPQVKILVYQIEEQINAQIMTLVAQSANINAGTVPLTVIGEQYFVGYANEETHGKLITELVDYAQEQDSPDQVTGLIKNSGLLPKVIEITLASDQPLTEASPSVVDDLAGTESAQALQSPPSLDLEKVELPLVGQVNAKTLSLPVFTLIIALLDGFNPCAMWALLFLISLLLGMHDRRRMWILGTAFILASGLVYFLFMTAWLNIFLFLGLITWVRIGIGLLA
ncbi:MAG: hypothetical protein GF390_01960, partial [Candidatus Pacebacteria bacterium]|nr:hypothetical protein [Candidatus Paceibacterota bacterium]